MEIRGNLMAKRAVLALLVGLMLAAAGVVQAGSKEDLAVAQALSRAYAEVAKKVKPAVVFVKVETTVEVDQQRVNPFGQGDPFNNDLFERFFRRQTPNQPRQRKYKQKGQGSGLIVTADGIILTNHHVVGTADKIKVKLMDGREFNAKRIGTDKDTDVAVIKIDADNLPTIPLGDSDAMEVGELVIAVGNPLGLAETVTNGIVSAKGRSTVGITSIEDFIQTNADINLGNSGGPLLNLKGEAIGINSAIYSRTGGSMGIGFAIPINLAKDVMDQLINTGKVRRAWLGIYFEKITPEVAEKFTLEDTDAAVIVQVLPKSPAEKADLKGGDIILELNGEKVGKTGDFRNTIAAMRPGDIVTLKILRDDKRLTVKVTLGLRPGSDELAKAVDGSDPVKKYGLTVQDLTADVAAQLGYKEGDGVLVASVEAGSIAQEKGLRRGMLILEVNRKKVKTAKEFGSAAAATPDKEGMLLVVTDGKFTRYVVLQAEE